MTTRGEIETLYDMVTTRAARAINLAGHALAVGNPANLVVLGVPDVLEALREHAAPLHVISHGSPVDLVAMKRLAARPVAK
jgi:cytosine deaminase